MKYKTICVIIVMLTTISILYYLDQQECEWKTVNCCPENAGAKWSCVKKSFRTPSCDNLILCAQVVSPKPSVGCTNVDGTCVIG